MISSCTDANGPSVTLGVEVYKKGLDEALKRGLKLRLITEINESNLKYCKELAKISELRHLEVTSALVKASISDRHHCKMLPLLPKLSTVILKQ